MILAKIAELSHHGFVILPLSPNKEGYVYELYRQTAEGIIRYRKFRGYTEMSNFVNVIVYNEEHNEKIIDKILAAKELEEKRKKKKIVDAEKSVTKKKSTTSETSTVSEKS